MQLGIENVLTYPADTLVHDLLYGVGVGHGEVMSSAGDVGFLVHPPTTETKIPERCFCPLFF